jgi:hypothetical protein
MMMAMGEESAASGVKSNGVAVHVRAVLLQGAHKVGMPGGMEVQAVGTRVRQAFAQDDIRPEKVRPAGHEFPPAHRAIACSDGAVWIAGKVHGQKGMSVSSSVAGASSGAGAGGIAAAHGFKASQPLQSRAVGTASSFMTSRPCEDSKMVPTWTVRAHFLPSSAVHLDTVA